MLVLKFQLQNRKLFYTMATLNDFFNCVKNGRTQSVLDYIQQCLLDQVDDIPSYEQQKNDLRTCVWDCTYLILKNALYLSAKYGYTVQFRSISQAILYHKRIFKDTAQAQWGLFESSADSQTLTDLIFTYPDDMVLHFVQTIEQFMAACGRSSVPSEHSKSVLARACKGAKLETAKYLMDARGPNFSRFVFGAQSLLKETIESRSLEMVISLMTRCGIFHEKAKKIIPDAICTAAELGLMDIVQYLNGFSTNCQVYFTPIHLACISGDHALLERLLPDRTGMELECNIYPSISMSPLLLALRRGHVKCVKLLLDCGVALPRESALHSFCYGCSYESEIARCSAAFSLIVGHAKDRFSPGRFLCSPPCTSLAHDTIASNLIFVSTYEYLDTMDMDTWLILMIPCADYNPSRKRDWLYYFDVLYRRMRDCIAPHAVLANIDFFYARCNLVEHCGDADASDHFRFISRRNSLVDWHLMCSYIEADVPCCRDRLPNDLHKLHRMFALKRGIPELRAERADGLFSYLEITPLDLFHLIFSFCMGFTFTLKMMERQRDHWRSNVFQALGRLRRLSESSSPGAKRLKTADLLRDG